MMLLLIALAALTIASSATAATAVVTSGLKDWDLLDTLRRCLQLTNLISHIRNRTGSFYHKVQWCYRSLYDWLLSIGLTPAKSLTLGPLAVPEKYFADFFRGCIDGDGTVLVYTDRYHAAKNERDVYQRLSVSLISASRPFVEWLQAEVQRLALDVLPSERPLPGPQTAQSRTVPAGAE